MSERDAFVEGVRHGQEHPYAPSQYAVEEALRRYPDAPPPGDGALRERIREYIATSSIGTVDEITDRLMQIIRGEDE